MYLKHNKLICFAILLNLVVSIYGVLKSNIFKQCWQKVLFKIAEKILAILTKTLFSECSAQDSTKVTVPVQVAWTTACSLARLEDLQFTTTPEVQPMHPATANPWEGNSNISKTSSPMPAASCPLPPSARSATPRRHNDLTPPSSKTWPDWISTC